MDDNNTKTLDTMDVESDQDVIELNLAEYLDEIFAFSY